MASKAAPAPASPKVRNIGIIAHIDAGKTTTTERMLYYSGLTKRIGDVDEGDTIMDYLPAERARGITITSAAITFDWNGHRINLIDTPGHADFTFEVTRSIRVLDGAVTVLDGVAGVEAQTEKVWRQTSELGIPKIVFVNKMDRDGAGFGRTVREVATKLGIRTCIVNMPLFRPAVDRGLTVNKFVGVIDVLDLRALEWRDGDGQELAVRELTAEERVEATKARTALVETLTELDDGLVEKFLELEDYDAIPSADVRAALRRCTLDNRAVPVLCGASFRNIGVQPLMDAVIEYLPGVDERPAAVVRAGADAPPVPVDEADIGCALAFKVIHEPRDKSMLVFVRVYAGTLGRGAKFFNTASKAEERVLKLVRMYADRQVEVDEIEAGNIGVISGVKGVRTGDTLLFKRAGSTNYVTKKNARTLGSLHLNPIAVPPPVFFAAVEPASLAEQKPVNDALEILLREDPSLHVSTDPDSGQLLLSGMGELHLEIATDRLVNDLRAKAQVGRIQISYRESFAVAQGASGPHTHRVPGAEAEPETAVTAELAAVAEDVEYEPETAAALRRAIALADNNYVTIAGRLSHAHLPADQLENSVVAGVSSALARGRLRSLPLHSIHVTVAAVDLPPEAKSTNALSIASRMAVEACIDAMAASARVFMEPCMDVAVTVDEDDVGTVMNDLSSARAGRIYAFEDDAAGPAAAAVDAASVYTPPDDTMYLAKGGSAAAPKRVIRAKVPLREMVGYLKFLRSMTKGRGNFVMNFDRYERVARDRAHAILDE
ncbi:P-loop containing nucleoside triphosphate hydrolase protein [Dipodascopsis tothii]|uniref:P-loop containing nucleoside triphosphate hydrolase protein n=1 Tax=Dipodascopsis tothii TaxID=44089 RepID=UPI0034CDA089